MAKAVENLEEARQVAAIGLAKLAARSACYAALHAAEAPILERTGQIAKTHSGVPVVFARLVRTDRTIGRQGAAFLAQAYKYKEIGDYGVGPDAVVTPSDAEEMLSAATDFVDRGRSALS